MIEKFVNSYGKLYKIRQIAGRIIKKTFYGDQLKKFLPCKGHLRGVLELNLLYSERIK